jgi:hypothetical protein
MAELLRSLRNLVFGKAIINSFLKGVIALAFSILPNVSDGQKNLAAAAG